MTGGFFNFNNHSQHGSEGNNNIFRRRKRSLLGRKNQSENDLAQRDQSPIVLPDNLKTVLLAGTPECWSLSSNANAATPCSQNDADLLSYAASIDLDDSPSHRLTSSAIPEEEDLESNEQNRQDRNRKGHMKRQHSLDFWPRFNAKSYTISRKESDVATSVKKEEQSPRQEQSAPTEPGSIIVVRPSPIPSLPPAQKAFGIWCKF